VVLQISRLLVYRYLEGIDQLKNNANQIKQAAAYYE
jgi:hypothetical protein